MPAAEGRVWWDVAAQEGRAMGGAQEMAMGAARGASLAVATAAHTADGRVAVRWAAAAMATGEWAPKARVVVVKRGEADSEEAKKATVARIEVTLLVVTWERAR